MNEEWTAQEDAVIRDYFGVGTFARVRRRLPERTAREVMARAEALGVSRFSERTRLCCRCKEVKPLTMFRKQESKPLGYGYWCLPCHRERDAEYQRQRRSSRKSGAEKVVRAEPNYPMPRMDLREQLSCVQLRKWRGPVNEGPLVPALGMPVVGMREAA